MSRHRLLAIALQSSAEPVFGSPNVNGAVSEGANFGLDMTPDGRFILFTAAGDDMAAGDSNQIEDLIVRDRMANTDELITPGSSLGVRGVVDYQASISADGLQASILELHVSSNQVLRLIGSEPFVCNKDLLPQDCRLPLVPAAGQTTLRLTFDLSILRNAADVNVALTPNEADPNIADDSASVTFSAPPPLPTDGGGGGGGAFGWMGLALLSLLLRLRSRWQQAA